MKLQDARRHRGILQIHVVVVSFTTHHEKPEHGTRYLQLLHCVASFRRKLLPVLNAQGNLMLRQANAPIKTVALKDFSSEFHHGTVHTPISINVA